MADFSSLKAVLSGSVIVKSENEKAYQKEVEGTWNAAIRSRQPCAFVRVASVKDVANTIKFCVQNKVSRSKVQSRWSKIMLGIHNIPILPPTATQRYILKK